MRSILVFAAIILMLAAFAAPVSAVEWVRMGPKTGVHLSTVSGDYNAFGTTVDDGWTSKEGINLGLYFNVGINKYLSIQPELYFAVKGAEAEFPVTFEDMEGTGEYKFRLDYWDLPILARVTIPTNLFFVPFLTAGPYVGYCSKADREAYFTPTGGRQMGVKDDIDAEITTLDYGLAAGAGVEFSIGSMLRLFLEARYQYGLANIRENTDDLKNRSLSFTTGFSLPIYTP
jgi:opacity protein-like surface antigen